MTNKISARFIAVFATKYATDHPTVIGPSCSLGDITVCAERWAAGFRCRRDGVEYDARVYDINAPFGRDEIAGVIHTFFKIDGDTVTGVHSISDAAGKIADALIASLTQSVC